MRSIYLLIIVFGLNTVMIAQNYPSGKLVLSKVSQNLSSKTRIVESTMSVATSRGTRIIETKTWSEGDKKAYVEILAPEKEKGTKMLKVENKLWIYSPKTKRSIEMSGQMLKQSMLGSDMSYSDMMDDSPLMQKYSATVTGEENVDGRKCWIVNLTAVKEGVEYYKQLMWVDEERNVPLKIELYSKTGKLLKKLEMSSVERVQGRWFPLSMVYKDMLKEGKDTEMKIKSIQFDVLIPANRFDKANLK